MKKVLIITPFLLLGFSLTSYAGTGDGKDGLLLVGSVIGFLLAVYALLFAIDYLRKNGRTMIYNTKSFLDKKIKMLKNYLDRLKSDYTLNTYP